jgi:hypothetical protein
MERGLIVEADAADWYEFDQDVTVQRVGFITDNNVVTKILLTEANAG